MLLGGKTVSGTSKPRLWDMALAHQRSSEKIPPGALVFWVPLAINIALVWGVGKHRSMPALQIPGGKTLCLWESHRMKEDICFINSETDDFNS